MPVLAARRWITAERARACSCVPILSDTRIQMPNGDQYHQGILTERSRRWISACWRMHVKAWFIWKEMIIENAVETGAVVIRQEHIVGSKLRIDLINSPIEHDS